MRLFFRGVASAAFFLSAATAQALEPPKPSLPPLPLPQEAQAVADLQRRMDTLEQMLQSRFEWSGEFESTYELNQRPPAAQSSKQEAAVRAHLRPRVDHMQKRYGLYMDLLFRADARNPDRNTVRIDEAYAKARLPWVKDFTIRAGKMIYNWGVDAFYNPTDFINPVDYYDFYHPDKLGVLAIDANYAFSNDFSLTFGIVPVFQPSIVSNPKSRWINYSQFISKAVLSRLALPSSLPSDYYIEFDLAHRAPEFPQPFFRLAYKGLGYDVAFAYSFRYRQAPQAVTFKSDIGFDAINSFPTGKLEGTPYYQQEHLLALDTNLPAFGGVLFAASTLGVPSTTQEDLPTTTQILSNYNSVGITGLSQADIEGSRKTTTFTGTIGFRKEWGDVQAFIQYASLWYLTGAPPASLFDKIGQRTGANPADVFDFFSGSVIPGVRWNFARRFWARAGSVVSLKRTGVIADLGVEYEFIDGFKIAAMYDYIEGKDGSLLDHYADNTRFGLTLNMVF